MGIAAALQSQSETQSVTPVPSETFATAKVPASQAPAVPKPIVPLRANEALTFLGVKPDIKDMTLDEKFECLKQCFAYGYAASGMFTDVTNKDQANWLKTNFGSSRFARQAWRGRSAFDYRARIIAVEGKRAVARSGSSDSFRIPEEVPRIVATGCRHTCAVTRWN